MTVNPPFRVSHPWATSPSTPPREKGKSGRLQGELFLPLICSSFGSIPHSYDLHSLFPNSSAFNLIPFTHTPVSFFPFFSPSFLFVSLLAALQLTSPSLRAGLLMDGDGYKVQYLYNVHNVFAMLYYSNVPGARDGSGFSQLTFFSEINSPSNIFLLPFRSSKKELSRCTQMVVLCVLGILTSHLQLDEARPDYSASCEQIELTGVGSRV